jgi:biopolymer transport protein ExbB/TolQ
LSSFVLGIISIWPFIIISILIFIFIKRKFKKKTQ